MNSPIPIRQPSARSITSPTPSERAQQGQNHLSTPSSVRLTPGPSADQRRARREQLRSFYGIKEGENLRTGEGGSAEVSAGPSSTGGSSTAGGRRTPSKRDKERKLEEKKNGNGNYQVREGDPLDPDSPGFNASKYYNDLIKRASLEELMKTASKLSSDVHTLQGSRHSLVYNHHHQLFAAGDTISVLNSRTPQLISIVNSLQDSFSSISQLVDSVALADAPKSPTSMNNRMNDDEVKLRRNVDRLKLMELAEVEPEKIRLLWDDMRPQLEDRVGENDYARVALEQCLAIVHKLPAINRVQDQAVVDLTTA